MLNYPIIYILYHCNQWKEHSSMRVIVASTSMSSIYNAIIKEIQLENMEYEKTTGRLGAKVFIDAVKDNKVNLDFLDYGIVEAHDNVAVKKLLSSKMKN